jgi:hypothetical protein
VASGSRVRLAAKRAGGYVANRGEIDRISLYLFICHDGMEPGGYGPFENRSNVWREKE